MMFRFSFTLTALVVLTLIVTACGSVTPTPRPTPTNAPPTVAPTQPPPTAPPTQPPTVAPTQTPVPVQATAKQDVNTRKGPGLEYPIAQKITKDAKATVVGKNADGKWLQIAFPDAANPSWVSVTFLNMTGPADTLPVVQVAVAPTATRGAPAPTKVAAVTATVAVPAPHGAVGFVYYESASSSYIVGGLAIDPYAIYPLERLGPQQGSFDINPNSRTSVPPFAWSPDNSTLLFVYNSSGGQSSPDILKYAKSNALDNQITIDSHKCISSPNWLSDNKTVVFIGLDDNNCTTQKIYKMALDGSTALSDRVLYTARSGESLRGLAWGSVALFVSNASGSQEIWRLNQDGSGAGQLTSDGRENGSPSWSPDGTKFAYYSKQTDGTYQIMVRNADGSIPRKLTSTGHNFSPAWSPDGNWIAFMSDRGGRADIYIMDKNGGQVKLLTTKNVGGLLPGSWR
jgi:Tol biopolymer transport system component